MEDPGQNVDDWTHAHFRRHAGFGQTTLVQPPPVRIQSGVAVLVGVLPAILRVASGSCIARLGRVVAEAPSNTSPLPDN